MTIAVDTASLNNLWTKQHWQT